MKDINRVLYVIRKLILEASYEEDFIHIKRWEDGEINSPLPIGPLLLEDMVKFIDIYGGGTWRDEEKTSKVFMLFNESLGGSYNLVHNKNGEKQVDSLNFSILNGGDTRKLFENIPEDSSKIPKVTIIEPNTYKTQNLYQIQGTMIVYHRNLGSFIDATQDIEYTPRKGSNADKISFLLSGEYESGIDTQLLGMILKNEQSERYDGKQRKAANTAISTLKKELERRFHIPKSVTIFKNQANQVSLNGMYVG